MKMLLIIFVFGGLGSVARYGFTFLNPVFQGFPTGTLLANIVACFIAGLTAGMVVSRPQITNELKAGILTGFCGGFSTFSTFSLETMKLMESQKTGVALAYGGISVAACFLGTGLGYVLGKKLNG